jgi:hypothetical protein
MAPNQPNPLPVKTHHLAPMKSPIKSHIIAVSAAAILGFTSAAHAAVILNEGLNNTGTNSPISSSSGKAINFVMGTGPDTLLTTIELGIGSITSSPTPLVQLWSNEATSTPIGSLLTTFTNPGTFTANSVNSFTHTGYTLTTGTTYWVVVTTGSGSFNWLGSNNTAVTSENGSTHTARRFGNPISPGTWNDTSSTLNQIRITAVPEPGAALLGGIGFLLLLRRRR